ncbi:MAG: DUF1934 domain-containing protein [Clostridia bacterium]|nr:DUF1934 domain-containing protein [Clostridia bacterium]
MKIPIDIRVKSERTFFDLSKRGAGNEHKDSDDFSVSGILKSTKNGFRIEYSEENGIVKTIIDTFDNETVSINRLGPINSHMVFTNGKSLSCICNTDLFPIQMLVRTKQLENSLSFDGGKLFIDYSVTVAGNLAENNNITFSISPDVSIIKS